MTVPFDYHRLSLTLAHPSPTPSYLVNFVAGCVGLSTAFAVMHPVDTLKTRMQAVSTSSSITFKTLFTRDVMRTLSRGFVASVVGAGPQGGTRLSTYELTKSYLLRPPSSSRSSHTPSHPLQHSLTPIPASAISAIVGDFASSIVKVPREVITARLQTGHYASSTSSSKPPGAMYAINRILHEEGPIGLFRGFWSTMARDCPFMVILFVTYESFKSNYQSQLDTIPSSPSDSIPTHTSTLYGGISGGLAGFFTTPFDVIKTRIMTHKTTSPSSSSQTPPPAAASVSSSSSSKVYTETVKAFWRGAVPRSCWWFCVCSIFFPCYEGVKDGLRSF
ncbi:mitochondrial carrier domain-containing protein [Paraphysoderma sedebokerense]|nr:mitochondrial carrier domain-containing protein [Paraphysoderma sedebokerense]